MALLAFRNNANTQNIGTPFSIPDSAIPSIRLKYGGVTNAETANNVMAHIVELLRHEIREVVVQEERNDFIAQSQLAETTVRADFEANIWPE